MFKNHYFHIVGSGSHVDDNQDTVSDTVILASSLDSVEYPTETQTVVEDTRPIDYSISVDTRVIVLADKERDNIPEPTYSLILVNSDGSLDTDNLNGKVTLDISNGIASTITTVYYDWNLYVMIGGHDLSGFKIWQFSLDSLLLQDNTLTSYQPYRRQTVTRIVRYKNNLIIASGSVDSVENYYDNGCPTTSVN